MEAEQVRIIQEQFQGNSCRQLWSTRRGTAVKSAGAVKIRQTETHTGDVGRLTAPEERQKLLNLGDWENVSIINITRDSLA